MSQDPLTDVLINVPAEASAEVVARAQRRRFGGEYEAHGGVTL